MARHDSGLDLERCAEAAREMCAAVSVLASLLDGAEERPEICVRADEEYAKLLGACEQASDADRARLHLGRLERMLSTSLARAAARCTSIADAVAMLEEHLDEPDTRSLGISARSAAAFAERLRQAAADWDPI